MRVRNLVLLGRTDRAELIERLRAAFTRWQNEWCAETHEPDVVLEDESDFALPACRWRTGALASGVKASVGFTPAQSHAFMSMLVGELPPDARIESAPSGLEAELSTSAVDALAAMLLDGREPVTAQIQWDAKEPKVEPLGYRCGVVSARCRLAALEMFMVLNPPLTAHYLSSKSKEIPRSRPPLMAVRQALADHRMFVEVSAGSAGLTLAELKSIAVGDVIMLDRRLDNPMSISIADGATCSGGYLGLSAGSKAVQLTVPNCNDGV